MVIFSILVLFWHIFTHFRGGVIYEEKVVVKEDEKVVVIEEMEEEIKEDNH